MAFEQSFVKVIGVEGRYSNNPNDSGGETMYGITKKIAVANGYTHPMKDMPLSVAKVIYKKQYWDINRLDEVHALSPRIAHELFDTGVNMGTATAASFLQRWLNALNRGESDFGDIEVDGQVGPITLYALKVFLMFRGDLGEVVLLRGLNSSQGSRYLELAENRKKDETFLFGWVANRVEI